MADLIDAATLHSRNAEPGLVLLDIRYTPGQADGKARYLAGHIPGALYVDLPTQLANPHAKGQGNNPLPTAEQLQRTLQGLGIHPHSEIVVYDDSNMGPAARAWWVLRWAGLQRVALLDGGLKAWQRAGGPLAQDDVQPQAGATVQVATGALTQLSAEQLLDNPAIGTLLDVRPAANFHTDQAGNGGHIPGALSLPAGQLLDEHGQLLGPDALKAQLEALGRDLNAPIGAYCGSGVAASLLVFTAERAGLQAALYPGSWSHWASDASRPVEA